MTGFVNSIRFTIYIFQSYIVRNRLITVGTGSPTTVIIDFDDSRVCVSLVTGLYVYTLSPLRRVPRKFIVREISVTPRRLP